MRNLIIFNTKIIGISEDELAIGDIVRVEYNNEQLTLVVYEAIDKLPNTISIDSETEECNPSGLAVKDIDKTGLDNKYDRVVYLALNEKLTKKYKKTTSQKLEKRMAKTLGGKTTPGSGAFSGLKGDVKSRIWLGEHKYTDKAAYRFEHKIWAKITMEAKNATRLPIMEIVLDQTNEHIKLMFVELGNFCDRTYTSEEMLQNFLFFKHYKPAKNASSVLLKTEDIKNHIDATYNLTIPRIPALLVTFTPRLSLVGFTSDNFETIFPEV